MFEKNKNQLPDRPQEHETMSRRTFLAGAATVALGGILVGCSNESFEKQTERPTTKPSPIPLETTAPPEATQPTEIMGVNGEYFSATPTWEQNFANLSEGPIDQANWNVLVGPGPGNAEAQHYENSTKNIRIEDGRLVLQSHVEDKNGYEYSSGRIDTRGKEDFMYGKFEVSAKLPVGIGTWPAVWLLPSEEIYLNQNPGVDFNSYYVDGEIDMLEAIGSEQNTIYGIAHSLDRPENPEYSNEYYATKVVPDADTTFHTYGLEWTPTNLTFSIDGEKYYSVNKQDDYDFRQWPYDQKYHLIMNLAMGGSWAGQQTDLFPGDGIDKSALPAAFEIEAVRYYPYVPTPIL